MKLITQIKAGEGYFRVNKDGYKERPGIQVCAIKFIQKNLF